MEDTTFHTLTTRTTSGTVIMTAAVRLVAQTELLKKKPVSFRCIQYCLLKCI